MPSHDGGAWLTRPRAVALVAAGVVFAFLLVLLPGPGRDPAGIGAAAGVAVVAVVLAALGRTLPTVARLGAPLAFVAMVALLIDSGGGTESGFGGLFLLPLLWLAILGSRSELVIGMAGVLLARALPVRIVGEPQYPSSEWRSAIVLGAVAIIACFTIQKLVRDARLRELELTRRAAELESASVRLAEQNDELRELDRLKDEFIALVSHELRTPLTSIIGYIELVGDEQESLSESQRRFLAIAARNVERLSGLVEELLFLVQLESRRVTLDLEDATVDVLLTERAALVRSEAEAKGIELRVESKPLVAVCDRPLIAQLVDCLLANAVMFTPEGGRVDVRAALNGHTVVISVSDTGIGIPADELPRLFERFYRGEAAVAEAVPGIGLGLALAHAIAAAHGATIAVSSEVGEGTTFRFSLPAVSG